MFNIYLKHLKQAVKNKKLTVILGSNLTHENLWNNLIKKFLVILSKSNEELQKYIEKLLDENIPAETFFRMLYKEIKNDVWKIFDNFKFEETSQTYIQIAELIKSGVIANLGIVGIDNRLELAFEKLNIKFGNDYCNIYDIKENKPVICSLNGNVSKKETIEELLSITERNFTDSTKISKDFFRIIKDHTETILVIGTLPQDFCWRFIYSELLNYGKKDVPIFWVTKQELIPLAHLISISGGGFIKKEPDEVLKILLDNFDEDNVIPAEENTKEFDWQACSKWIEEDSKDIRWYYFIASLLMRQKNRKYSRELFESLLPIYKSEKMYSMVGFCHRNIGKILLDQGFMEKAIEEHIKALEYWAKTKDEANMAEEYTICAYNYWNGAAADKALQYYGEALSIYCSLDDTEGIEKIAGKLALLCENEGDYELAENYYMESLKANEILGDVKKSLQCSISFSNFLVKTQNWQEAKNYLEKSLNLANQSSLFNNFADIYQLLGLVHINLGEPKKAREYYEKAYNLYISQQDNLSLTSIYCNLGHVYTHLKEYSSAVNYYEKAVQLYDKMNDWSQTAAIYTNLGLLHTSLNNTEEAEEYLSRCEEIFVGLGDINNLIKTYNNLAKVYLLKGELNNAIECYSANIEMQLHLDKKEDLANTLIGLALAYLQKEEFEEALQNFQKALTLYESLNLIEEKEKILSIIKSIETKLSESKAKDDE